MEPAGPAVSSSVIGRRPAVASYSSVPPLKGMECDVVTGSGRSVAFHSAVSSTSSSDAAAACTIKLRGLLNKDWRERNWEEDRKSQDSENSLSSLLGLAEVTSRGTILKSAVV